MPFFDDIETRDEARGSIWGPFATIRDNVERLVVLNVGWAAQLMPGILALAFPSLPLGLRIAMVIYSVTVAIPATGVLYALALAGTRGEHLSLELAFDEFRALALPSLLKLPPLFGVFGVLIWAAIFVGPRAPAATTFATLAALLWYLCASYWGPLLVARPDTSTLALARRSVQLVWRYPAETLATALVAAIAMLVGMVSVGGLVLIAPVVVALLHAERYLDLMRREAALSMRE